jgi:hypothetical protein
MYANLAQSIEHRRSAVFIETPGQLVHLLSHCGDTFRTGFRQSGSGHIVAPVHRTGLVAVQVRTVPSKRNEVPHRGAPLPLKTPIRESRIDVKFRAGRKPGGGAEAPTLRGCGASSA